MSAKFRVLDGAKKFSVLAIRVRISYSIIHVCQWKIASELIRHHLRHYRSNFIQFTVNDKKTGNIKKLFRAQFTKLLCDIATNIVATDHKISVNVWSESAWQSVVCELGPRRWNYKGNNNSNNNNNSNRKNEQHKTWDKFY